MDNVRLILIMALIFVLLLLYQAWQKDYGPQPTDTTNTTSDTGNTTPSVTDVPDTTNTSAQPAELPVSTPAQRIIPTQDRIQVQTDVFKIEIDTLGGDVRRVELRDYPVAVETPEIPFRLMNDELPHLFIVQSGLLPKENAPTHQALYQSEQSVYRLETGQDTLTVKLHWQNDKGLQVDKIYQFKRGHYTVQVQHVIKNETSALWQGRLYGQIQRTDATSSEQSRFIYTYTGGALSSPQKLYEKISFKEMSEGYLAQEQRPGWKGGWAAMLQHYFVAAWIPQSEQIYDYYANALTQNVPRYVLGLYGPVQDIEPHAQHTFQMQLYIGPKSQDVLKALSPGLDLTVDYGWLWFIAQPLFWMLQRIYALVGNWGWAIVILTILIKLAFFQLSATSYKSMANMRRLHPRLVALKERYGDNKAGLNQAMMDLYKQEKINPLGGCLPILIQIPVFIALYWVLLESVELRQASFTAWLNDLSSPDPYFVLPLIMGATMLLQHYLNPAPIDPVQQKVMMVLPIVFTVFFAFFPSGLVLYWVVNNVLSIAQQWVITKKIVASA